MPANPTPPLPRVLVIGIDSPIGLTIIRELGRHGVEVHGVARSADGLGLSSKWLTKGHIVSGPEPQQLAAIQEVVRDNDIAAVMAISETDLLWLNENRHVFPNSKLLFPETPLLSKVLDKATVLATAQSLGISTPKTIQPRDAADTELPQIRFPVIMKWASPTAVVPDLQTAGLPYMKAEYAYDRDDLNAKLGRYDPIKRYPLVQEFCAGHGLGQSFLMHNGEVALYFQHRRLHEWPPEGGFGTLSEGLPPDRHGSLQRQSIALLNALQWDGIAMVEYRYDPNTGRATLMEINGRFWGSLPLAHYCGAEFAWELYRLKVLGQPAVPLKSYRTDIRCAFMFPELKRWFVIAFARRRIQNRLLRFSVPAELMALARTWLDRRTRYYVFSVDDPKPFLSDFLATVRAKFSRTPQRRVLPNGRKPA